MNTLSKNEWEAQIDKVCALARFFTTCNVIDVSFESGHKMEVYVALSETQRSQGLSRVSESQLPVDGMLFVFEKPSYAPFGMINMEMDLDIAWYDKSGKLIKFQTVPADYPVPICSPEPFSYVLEAPAGTLPRTNLKLTSG